MKSVLKQIGISILTVSGLAIGFVLLMHVANFLSAIGF